MVDVILDGVDERLGQCDMIFLCTPVEYNEQYLAAVKPFLKEGAIVTDVGSTKDQHPPGRGGPGDTRSRVAATPWPDRRRRAMRIPRITCWRTPTT